MAMSTCVKCGGQFFEVRENSPFNSNFKLFFVQCTTCGGVVGVTDYYNTGAQLEQIKKHLGIG